MNAQFWRGGVLAGVILLHAGAVAALQGLNREPAPQPATTAPVLVAAILAEPEPEPAPAPAAAPPPEARPQVRPVSRPAKPVPAPAVVPAAASSVPAPAEPSAPPAAVPPPTAPAVPAPPPVQEPAAVSCRIPAYPTEAKRRGETGTVLLQLLIDSEGGVMDQRVERSSNHAALDDAAMAALSKCRFKPGTVDGRPQQAWARLRYVWKLE